MARASLGMFLEPRLNDPYYGLALVDMVFGLMTSFSVIRGMCTE